MVRVKCIKEYNDLKLDRVVTPNDDVYEVTDARAATLVKAGVAEVVAKEEVPTGDEKPVKKPTKKKGA